MKKLILSIFIVIAMISCKTTDLKSSTLSDNVNFYMTTEELKNAQPPYRFFKNANGIDLQYPSGSESIGMLSRPITKGFKNKYFTLYTDEKNTEYLRFSLDASDKGKSKNGSSVRVELKNRKEWKLKDKQKFSYTFFTTTTNPLEARYTVGQFLQCCDLKDSPLCRIEVENYQLNAVVCNYQADGKTKPDSTHKYPLGSFNYGDEISISMEINNGTLKIYRDSQIKVNHTFHETVERNYLNYFKLGIYYQNKDSPKIFSEVFVKNLEWGAM